MIKRYVSLKLAILCLVGFLCFNLNGFGQTTIINPVAEGGFENGTTFAANGWTATTGTATQNQWVCNTGATPGFTGVRAAYVTNNTAGTPPPHSYTVNATRVSHLYRNVTIPAGEADITLSFDVICNGESGFTDYDYLRVWKIPAATALTYGTAITANANRIQLGSTIVLQNSWNNVSITLPQTLVNTTFRLVFEWTNDGSLGNNPPAAVDNISLVSKVFVPNANDNCAGATALSVSPTTTCTTSASGTTVGATQSIAAITCGAYTGNADDDVWYSFVATATTHIVTVNSGTISDPVVEVRSGACNGTNIACADTTNATEVITASGLTVGATYYVRIYSYGGNGNQGTFNICVTTPVDPCSSITNIASCGTTITPTFASGNGTYSPGNCGFGTPGMEKIYSFTPAVSGNYDIQQNSSFGYIDYFYKLASGGCSGTGWTCINDVSGAGLVGTVSLVGGNTYYFMLDPEGTGGGNVSFTINCPPPVPANDLCANATALPCGTSNLAGTTVGTVNAANGTGCGVGSNYGVWYTFVGDGQQTTISSTATFDHSMNITRGTCGSQTSIQCVDGTVSGTESYTFITTNGTTYYVYISHYSNSSTITGTFTISRTCTPTTPPVNGSCATATTLACGDTVTGNTTFTTGTTVPPASCNNLSPYGVWYTFLGTGGQMIVTATPTASYNIKLSVTTGTACAGFANVPSGCTNAGGGAGQTESVSFNSVLGTTYYVYVAANGTSTPPTGTFSLSLSCCSSGPDPTLQPSCGVVAGGLGLNGANPPSINCSSGGCVDLEAEYIKIGNTSRYRVEQIPYSNVTSASAFLPIAGLADDTFSNIITLPWAFCFYGTTYNDFVYGANGVISFDSARLAGGGSGYRTIYNIPNAINASLGSDYYFGPSIFGVHHDIDPSVAAAGKLIGRTIDNTPGCERMILVWENVPMFDNGNFGNNSIRYSGKMVLYKNTNIIEIYIQEKRIDTGSWNDGNASVGLQHNATDGIAAPCRNTLDPNWVVTAGEAWRFVPDDGDITSIRWLADSGSGFAYIPGLDGNDTPNVCPNVTTTYRAEVTYTPACGAPYVRTDDTVVTVGDKVWNGSVNTNWYLDTNWTPVGVPTAADCVIIPDVATSNNRSPIADIVVAGGTIPTPPSVTALAKNVSVRNNGSLTINADTYLEIVDDLNVQPNGDVLIRSTGSLIQLTDVATNNNTGSIRVQREATGVGSQNYVYWSSPVEGFSVNDINTAASELRWQWNPTYNGINYGTWVAASGPMTVGKGYIVRGLATPPAPIPVDNAQFTGRPNNGIITVPITRGTYTSPPNPVTYAGAGNSLAYDIDDNWNLVGNPYPSAISADDFIVTNASLLADNPPPVLGTIYLWQRAGLPGSITDPFYGDYASNYVVANYVSYNSSGANPNVFNGSIASGQSFFIQMDDAVGVNANVTFNNGMRSRTLANDNFLRTLERHRIWLELIDSSISTVSSTLVGYIQNATNNQDRLYDGYDVSDSDAKLYSLLGERELAIQGRALPFDQEDMVPLGIITSQPGNYKIAINSVDGLFTDPSQNIYLEDTYLNVIYDLRIAPYEFTSESGTFNDRFILRYTNETLSTPDEVANFGFNIIGLNDYIKVTSGNSPINTIMVYDVLGRVLANYKDVNALEFKINLVNQSKGTLIVKATLYNGQQKIKKVIY
ncbi:MAG: T9SS sorting signal type C domain-containing protein [Gelidibacter sp.]